MDERTRKVMMSSKSHEWFTPRNIIFDPLHKKYNFTTDPCTSANNPLKLPVFYTEEQVRHQWWFGNGSNNYNNIAIVMGRVSGCAVVGIDTDGPPLAWQHQEAKLAAAAPGNENLSSTVLKNTMTNKTGSGGDSYHVIVKEVAAEDYYDQVGRIVRNNEIWASGDAHSQIRIQTEEGMYLLVIPPSVHSNGKLYEWNGKLPALISADDLAQFVELASATIWESLKTKLDGKPVEGENQTGFDATDPTDPKNDHRVEPPNF
jgi:hypothetical protein